MGSRDLVQEFWEVIGTSGAQGGGQEAMGSGDLVQEVQGGHRYSWSPGGG